jgi:hypothetical protein
VLPSGSGRAVEKLLRSTAPAAAALGVAGWTRSHTQASSASLCPGLELRSPTAMFVPPG